MERIYRDARLMTIGEGPMRFKDCSLRGMCWRWKKRVQLPVYSEQSEDLQRSRILQVFLIPDSDKLMANSTLYFSGVLPYALQRDKSAPACYKIVTTLVLYLWLEYVYNFGNELV